MPIEVVTLQKAYATNQVLRGVDFVVPDGSITGLLGPNGSGKTTLLRCMVGLARADAGEAFFDGTPYVRLAAPGASVGCLLDATAHHPGRSTRETVTLRALALGVPAKRVDEVLRLVGLESAASRRFGALSLGMKQRVGIATALLGRPRHLLLDEPTNGLDIETIRWVRDLLVRFAHDEGGSVLISSHLLQELQTFADRVVILDAGRVAYEGPVAATLDQASCTVRTPDPGRLASALASAGIAARSDVTGTLVALAPADVVGDLAWRAGLPLHELVPGQDRSLEQFYLSVTQGSYTPRKA